MHTVVQVAAGVGTVVHTMRCAEMTLHYCTQIPRRVVALCHAFKDCFEYMEECLCQCNPQVLPNNNHDIQMAVVVAHQENEALHNVLVGEHHQPHFGAIPADVHQ